MTACRHREELGGEAKGLRGLVAGLGAAVLLRLRLVLVELLQLGLDLLAQKHLRQRGNVESSQSIASRAFALAQPRTSRARSISPRAMRTNFACVTGCTLGDDAILVASAPRVDVSGHGARGLQCRALGR